ncbi:MAG TPA: ADP-ribosylglycohydrolase family protein [Limnobacter sp.]|nr:ADP-ribosylglycohydrolase family protein [Limnobacter sp.]
MTIPSVSAHPAAAASANIPLANRIAQAPIHTGVDSHSIRFKIQGPFAPLEVPAVVGASSASHLTPAEVWERNKPILLEAFNKGACLVGFGSGSSLDRIANGSNQALKSNSSSLIEQLCSIAATPIGNLKLSDSVTLQSMSINPPALSNGVKFVSGTLTFLHKGDTAPHVLEFREFYPEYDGLSLSAKSLIAALDQLPAQSSAAALGGKTPHKTKAMQFYSARGVGRSASLAVLHAFREMSMKQSGFAPAEVRRHLHDLIQQGRVQRSPHFINTAAQQEALLSACEEVNKQALATRIVTTRAPIASALLVRPPIAPIAPIVQELSTRLVPFGNGAPALPYMPIRPAGIHAISQHADFGFPRLSTDEARVVAADVIRCGFYGDALGSELESKTYPERRGVLVNRLAHSDESTFFQAVPDATQRDNQLIAQLRKKNHLHHSGPTHCATDDTQQGALSALAKTRWMLSDGQDLDQLAVQVMQSFHEPAFPAPMPNQFNRFEVRGGANTLYMCKFATDVKANWKDVAIEDVKLIRGSQGEVVGIEKLGARAGGAGNGGMMRIGYDLLPMLGSNATTQDLIEQALVSNQLTHPSSFSAVACVGQVVMMAKCIHLRLEACKRPDRRLVIPPNFFIDTYHAVAKALEHPEQRFGLLNRHALVPMHLRHQITSDGWRAPRLPSEFLKPSAHTREPIRLGSVEQALIDSKNMDNTSANVDCVLQRWSSSSYLAATFPSVVYLLEQFGRGDPAHAVNMAALVTKDSDTCATIVAQVMGALHGSAWVEQELNQAVDSSGRFTFSSDLGAGFSVNDWVAQMDKFYQATRASLPGSLCAPLGISQR